MPRTVEVKTSTVERDYKDSEGGAVVMRAVVGMEDGGKELWLPEGQRGPLSRLPLYERDEAEETVLRMSRAMRKRLLGFFNDYLLPNAGAEIGDGDPYDCHFFARLIRGEPALYHVRNRLDVNERLAGRVIRDGIMVTEEPRLQLGQLGVLGFKAHAENGPVVPQHSLLGLGEGDEECIHVLGKYGPLAVSSYEAVTEHYRLPPGVNAMAEPRTNPDEVVYTGDYGLFVAETPAPA